MLGTALASTLGDGTVIDSHGFGLVSIDSDGDALSSRLGDALASSEADASSEPAGDADALRSTEAAGDSLAAIDSAGDPLASSDADGRVDSSGEGDAAEGDALATRLGDASSDGQADSDGDGLGADVAPRTLELGLVVPEHAARSASATAATARRRFIWGHRLSGFDDVETAAVATETRRGGRLHARSGSLPPDVTRCVEALADGSQGRR